MCYFVPDPVGGVGPPDVPSQAQARGSRVDLPANAMAQGMSRGQSRSSMMETADGTESVCVQGKKRVIEKHLFVVCYFRHTYSQNVCQTLGAFS